MLEDLLTLLGEISPQGWRHRSWREPDLNQSGAFLLNFSAPFAILGEQGLWQHVGRAVMYDLTLPGLLIFLILLSLPPFFISGAISTDLLCSLLL